MRVKLVSRFVMKAFHRGLFQRAVHPFDLAVGPRVGRLGKALFNTPLVAELAKGVAAQVGVLGQVAKPNAVIGQHFNHLVRHPGQDPLQERHGDGLGGLRVQVGEGPLAGAVNGDKEVLLAFFGLHFGLHFGKINVQIADGVVLEPGFFACFFFRRWRQAADAVALQTAVQGRAAQVGNGLLEGVEAVVKGQQDFLAKQDDGGFCRRA